MHAAPVFDGRHLLISGFDGRLRAVDPRTGSPRWAFKTIGAEYFPRGDIQRAPAVVDGIAYFAEGAPTEEFRALYRSGRGLEAGQRILALGSIAGTPVVHDTTVYVASADGTLYALKMP